jgi:hypothetical protein
MNEGGFSRFSSAILSYSIRHGSYPGGERGAREGLVKHFNLILRSRA